MNNKKNNNLWILLYLGIICIILCFGIMLGSYVDCAKYLKYLNVSTNKCIKLSLTDSLTPYLFYVDGIVLIVIYNRKKLRKKEKNDTSIINNYDVLKKLKELLDTNIITQEEFENEKKKILK